MVSFDHLIYNHGNGLDTKYFYLNQFSTQNDAINYKLISKHD